MILLAVVALCAAGSLAFVARGVARARPTTPGRGPQPGEFWFAPVPFEDGTGVKDRPVLVLGRRGTRMHVLPLTSTNQSQRGGYRPVDTRTWDHPGRGTSWLNTTRVVRVELVSARRRVAGCPPMLWLSVGMRHPWLVLTSDQPTPR